MPVGNSLVLFLRATSFKSVKHVVLDMEESSDSPQFFYSHTGS